MKQKRKESEIEQEFNCEWEREREREREREKGGITWMGRKSIGMSPESVEVAVEVRQQTRHSSGCGEQQCFALLIEKQRYERG